ncbi:MAG TPA: DUF3368 domain-containing protein [bacterium]|nr:DUF3368 domain-containing protein [bacterium]
MRNIISNTSCLIILDNLEMLYILKELYGNIIITEEVFNEFGKEIPDWIKVVEVKNRNYLKILNTQVDLGEASTIALAMESENNVIILDDLKARKLSKTLKLKMTGTLGILLKAKEMKIITSIENILSKMEDFNFRISLRVKNYIIQTAKKI